MMERGVFPEVGRGFLFAVGAVWLLGGGHLFAADSHLLI